MPDAETHMLPQHPEGKMNLIVVSAKSQVRWLHTLNMEHALGYTPGGWWPHRQVTACWLMAAAASAGLLASTPPCITCSTRPSHLAVSIWIQSSVTLP